MVNYLLALPIFQHSENLGRVSVEIFMPGGTYHEVFGFLHKAKHTLTLLTPDGRLWRVDAPFSAQPYLENDVWVYGLTGPDSTLYVDKIEIAPAARRRW
jgi:hypothetical protein